MSGIAVNGRDVAGGVCRGAETGWYRVEDHAVALQGDPVEGHGESPHNGPVLAEGKAWYTVDGIPVAFAGCKATCGHVVSGRSWYSALEGPEAEKAIIKSAPRRGTYFFGGAGLNGAYIGDMVSAFREAGLDPVSAGNGNRWSVDAGEGSLFGMLGDAFSGVPLLRDGEDTGRPLGLDDYGTRGTQFNLVGYSYGSLVAAQVAVKYARAGGVVDHLVLIGSPVSRPFLDQLRATEGIARILVRDLSYMGDPIRAGMTLGDLVAAGPVLVVQFYEQSGHFRYSPMTAEAARKRRKLAAWLYEVGLR
ncbi:MULTISPECIES: hypothetical protein [unclassified Haematospirillum]|uniref:hypothetical protein n=1 Tax=unclassified Haematospirillum TaxID=2622088 RepID=UPI00143B9B56|nr:MULTISPECIES: hypothetical protein [unclassified Haematospirillum]NKD55979.1 hypothetical protein [Haematospirillum sp. H4890]NKD75286.1 hypothetical protein [Haematospirillum sp. H4485]